MALALPPSDAVADEVTSSDSNAEMDQAVSQCVSRRIRCTVRIRPLPSGCRLPDLLALCPSAVAARLPWNRARCRHKGVAFLEFASPEAAVKHAQALQGSRALGGGRELATSVHSVPDAGVGAVDPGSYSRRRVVVSSMDGRVQARQLLELAPGAQRVQFAAAGVGGRGRHAPGVAVVTFADARRALDAVRSCQGALIGEHKTSWMLEKLTSAPKPRNQVDRRTLVLSGVTKSMTDTQLLLALPHCSRLERRGSGTAVAAYDTEAACAADLAAWPGGPQLPRAGFGHRPHPATSAGARRQPLQQQQRTRLVAVGLPDGTVKSDLRAFAREGLSRVALASNGRLAVLTFATEAAAEAARARFRSVAFRGARVRVAFSLDHLAMRKNRKPKSSGKKTLI